MTLVQEIKNTIEKCLDQGKQIAIYPLGDLGIQTKMIMKEVYGISPIYIFDNHLCEYNSEVRHICEVDKLNMENVIIIYTIAKDNDNNDRLREQLTKRRLDFCEYEFPYYQEEYKSQISIGKHSYGDLCNSEHAFFVEEIGSFCSIASGVRVVENHATKYISTSPFIYYNKSTNPYIRDDWDDIKDLNMYIEGIVPKGIIPKATKTVIGNDVWLGRNVTITNGANIGNGVIAGAGAVITKDVPDYAVVAGVPARVIRFRYTPEQIEALNRICWWNWSDDEIRERYDDFFLPIEEFIDKYDSQKE